ncbi:T-box transcription factor TBX22 [Gastrophryne carolinensis]
MALSTRARGFSVEALVGKRKLEEQEGAPEEQDGAPQTQEEPEKRPRSAPGGPDTSAHPGAQLELQGGELWRRFHRIGTEMIITKAGRRMFPSVRVKVKGLDPDKQYYIAMDIIPVDSKRYRYVYHSSQWMVAGNTDHSCISPRLYIHPDSPCSGETWMRQIVSFDRVKLTNNEMDDKGHIILQSMHKYRPRLHVIGQDSRFDLLQIQSLPAEGVKSFSFKETEFTTVTAYQNQQITKLKIDRNPFAKGFRDPGRNRAVLDGLLESYPWRPALPMDFKVTGGSCGSSPITPSGGALSPSCSPPSFQLPPGPLGLLYSDNYLPLCYRICPSSALMPPGLFLPDALEGALMVDVPFLSAFRISKPNKLENPKGERAHAGALGLQAPPPAAGACPTSGIHRETLQCSVHPSYGFFSYNIAAPPHFGHFKMADTYPVTPRDGRANNSRWTAPANHFL